MTALILTKPLRNLLVIGPLYNKIEKLSYIENIISNYDYIILNGGVSFPDIDANRLEQHVEKINNLIQSGKVFYILGRQDLLLLKQLDINNYISRWLRSRPNVIIADFPTRSVVILDGGIPHSVKSRSDLFDNLEISFITHINGKPWHQQYNGRLGYVISNSPLTKKETQYYNYSMQLGNIYNQTDFSIYAQEVNDIGLSAKIEI